MSSHIQSNPDLYTVPPAMTADDKDKGVSLVQWLGARSIGQILWHRIVWHRRVVVSFAELPEKLSPVHRLLLSMAHGVVVEPDMAGAVAAIGISKSRIILSGAAFDHSAFMAYPVRRETCDAYRIAYAGELSPQSGVADFLSCAIHWAERTPSRKIELIWLGSGDLEGVLRAQLLPSNVQQRFLDMPSQDERAAIFAHCGALVAPTLSECRGPFIAEAMAAGLVILGSIRSAQIRSLVVGSGTGWTFDPLVQEEMSKALDSLFACPPDLLDDMRGAARAKISALQSECLGDALSRPQQSRLPQMMATNSPIEV